MTEFFLGPGERINTIAIGPAPGEYAMRTIPFENEAWRKPGPSQQMATILSSGPGSSVRDAEAEILNQRLLGSRWIERRPVRPDRAPPDADLLKDDRQVFMINEKVVEERRIDQTVRLGDTEEWTIVNIDQQYHSFHIHQTPFLVTEVNGVSQNEDSLRDTFYVRPATDAALGTLRIVSLSPIR